MKADSAKTVAQYLAALPRERRLVLAAVRAVIRRNLPKGYTEAMSWGFIAYEVPLKRHPDTYNGRPLSYACLAAQKSHLALYLTCAYQDPRLVRKLEQAFEAAGKKLDMGKSCLRFSRLEDLDLGVIGEIIASTPVEDYIAQHEAARRAAKRSRPRA